jgi:hypothetical protein
MANDQIMNKNEEFEGGGSPEFPSHVANQQEHGTEKEEVFGYEALKRIEASSEHQLSSEQLHALEKAERKEGKAGDDPNDFVPEPDDSFGSSGSDEPEPPKYFGYSLPPKMVNDFKNIAKQKKKGGDPNESKTWIYVLLDRILKMRSINS